MAVDEYGMTVAISASLKACRAIRSYHMLCPRETLPPQDPPYAWQRVTLLLDKPQGVYYHREITNPCTV
ncbi:hypothetical protein [Treponema endosymbiont of Eucomonympha sp.]|uniref:hypothetical protein n=1 Tax=Treponema endosymbiont of Eucomonympha sp. TaxID=1580831 RepID=UPI0016505061|nr:hypothetical protein [Treponema endosymbiont of Eucomonympha sp.]